MTHAPEQYRPPTRAAAALKGLCPRCGAASLFAGITAFAPKCSRCQLDFASFDVGDGAAAFLILIVGAIVVVGAIWLELAVSPPYWVHAIWIPIALGLTLLGLRIAKALLIFQIFSQSAREGKIVG